MNVVSKIKGLIPESFKRNYHKLQFLFSSFIHGMPGKRLKIIGVTGTSGKSTTAEIIYHVLLANEVNAGVISTIGAKTLNKELATGLHVTTPDPFEIPKYLGGLRKDGAEYIVLECSSHALAQGRLGNLKFDFAVFTNITSDHLDWHKTWENYALSKAKLIDALKPSGVLILNDEDSRGTSFLSAYAEQHRPDVKISKYDHDKEKNISVTIKGLEFRYKNRLVHIPLIGEYNAENALAAIKITEELGFSLEKTIASLSNFRGIPGRMQVIAEHPFLVIIDFAHNADSLERSLATLKKLLTQKGRLITVFGSAGLRDREKRKTMGQVSGRLSDITIITAEDPRTESLHEINSEIVSGAKTEGAKLLERFKNSKDYQKYDIAKNIPNKSIFSFDEASVNGRFDAIDMAIRLANTDDIVVTEGKGHEESLCFGNKEYPYTDNEAINKALSTLAKNKKIV